MKIKDVALDVELELLENVYLESQIRDHNIVIGYSQKGVVRRNIDAIIWFAFFLSSLELMVYYRFDPGYLKSLVQVIPILILSARLVMRLQKPEMSKCVFDTVNECLIIQVRAEPLMKVFKQSGIDWEFYVNGSDKPITPSFLMLLFVLNICARSSLPFSSITNFEIRTGESNDSKTSRLFAAVGTVQCPLIFTYSANADQILGRIAAKVCNKPLITTENGKNAKTLWPSSEF